MGKVVWTPDRLKEFVQMRKKGRTAKEIAAHYKITASAVQAVIDRHAVPRRNYEPATMEELGQIHEWLREGFSYGRIAIKLGGGRWTSDKVRNTVGYYTRRAVKGYGPWVGRIPRRNSTREE